MTGRGRRQCSNNRWHEEGNEDIAGAITQERQGMLYPSASKLVTIGPNLDDLVNAFIWRQVKIVLLCDGRRHEPWGEQSA
jgi:hypothetical protein